MKNLWDFIKGFRNKVLQPVQNKQIEKPRAYSSLFDLMRDKYPKADLREISLPVNPGDNKRSEFYDGNSSLPLRIPDYYECNECGYVDGLANYDNWVYSCRICGEVLFEEIVGLKGKVSLRRESSV